MSECVRSECQVPNGANESQTAGCGVPSMIARRRFSTLMSVPSMVAAATVCLMAFKPVPLVSAAAKPAQTRPVEVSLDRKVAWILRLEQQRQLRDAVVTVAPLRTDSATGRLVRRAAASADLTALVADPDPVVRRRAALAIGRVGLTEGEPFLVASLKDDDDLVREQAAFGLGLIGAKDAAPALIALLKDAVPMARGRAAEALGLIGQPPSASAISTAFAGCRGLLSGLQPDDETGAWTPDVDACRLAIFALVRLRSYDALAAVVLDDAGQPASSWWPVAFALQRLHDPKSAPALLTLARVPAVCTPAFAIRGLAAIGNADVLPIGRAIAADKNADVRLRVTAVAAIGRLGAADGAAPLLALATDPSTPRNLALEAVTAAGATKDRSAFAALLTLMHDAWPSMRAAALSAAAAVDADDFLLVVPSFAPDPDWSVRAALAGIFSKLPPAQVRGALEDLLADPDLRVKPAALEALAAIHAPDLAARLSTALADPDFVLRATAARLMGDLHPDGGAEKLSAAYARGAGDASYTARVAALEALAKFGGDAAKMTLRRGLADPEWPVRARASALLASLGETDVMAIAPAPLRQPIEFFESATLLHPKYSPLALVETSLGTIEIELNVVEAPITTAAFMDLARAGFYNGIAVHRVVPNFVVQAGDPRGDGEGGPGFSIKDELSTIPFVRGTVGMALDFKDTGGSQFFVTVSPQPHLDGKYTVFGKVTAGLELLDRMSQWDVIQKVTIIDGSEGGVAGIDDRRTQIANRRSDNR